MLTIDDLSDVPTNAVTDATLATITWDDILTFGVE